MVYVAVPIDATRPVAREGRRDGDRDRRTSGGPVLAFCRSGTRSTFLWALARSLAGVDADTLIDQARGPPATTSPRSDRSCERNAASKLPHR